MLHKRRKKRKRTKTISLYGVGRYKRKQLEFETEQILTYVTMSVINVYKNL